MKSVNTSVSLSNRLHELTIKEAKRRGLSHSSFLRMLIIRSLSLDDYGDFNESRRKIEKVR